MWYNVSVLYIRIELRLTVAILVKFCNFCRIIDKQDGVRLLWSLLKSPNTEVCEKDETLQPNQEG